MTITYEIDDNVEPVAGDTVAQIASVATYNVQSGCAATYNAGNMQVTIAAGVVTHSGTTTTVAGDTVTLVSDPTNPRWAWIAADSGGAIDLILGTAGATPAVPAIGDRVALQLIKIQAAQTIADNCEAKLDKRVFSASSLPVGYVTQKYKSATQVFTTTTTLADVTASSGTFSFAIAASEVWQVEYWVPLTFGGTGGAKFQITGAAAPTAVSINGYYGRASSTAAGSFNAAFDTVTAFATDISSQSSAAAGGNDAAYVNSAASGIYIRAVVINGANAGTVTLQAAQQNANSTTTLGIGSLMRAIRVA